MEEKRGDLANEWAAGLHNFAPALRAVDDYGSAMAGGDFQLPKERYSLCCRYRSVVQSVETDFTHARRRMASQRGIKRGAVEIIWHMPWMYAEEYDVRRLKRFKRRPVLHPRRTNETPRHGGV